MPESREERRSRYLDRLVKSIVLSLALHLIVLGTLAILSPDPEPTSAKRPLTYVPVTVNDKEKPKPKEAKPEPKPDDPKDEEDDPRQRGQIVEIAPPKDQTRPEDSDYLAEYNSKVEEESRSERFRLNPEVVAPSFSQKDAYKLQDLLDLGADKPSTGAKTGTGSPLPPVDGQVSKPDIPEILQTDDGVKVRLPEASRPTFDPARDGRVASLPSPFLITNKDGLDRPVPSSHTEQDLSGSPGNDLLKEKVGPGVNLNTREIQYAGYINRIKRMVSFYWNQNLDNLPGAVRARLSSPRYETVVFAVLDKSGRLLSIEVTHASQEDALDQAVVQAFRIAGPFPNPPEQLIARDGRVYLDDMGFVVESGHARMPYTGVDPRAGVQFPGILKATR